MNDDQKCKNCGESITLVNYALGPQWMHNPPGYTGMKTAGGAYNVFWHCRKSVAAPPHDANDDRPIPVKVVELLAEIEELQRRVEELRAIEQRRVDEACRQTLERAARAAGLT